MAPIPPGRAMARTMPAVLVVSLALGGLLYLQGDPVPALFATGVVAVTMLGVMGQAPARLAWRLQEFDGQVPDDSEASIAWHGEQTLEWPDRPLTVHGNIHRYRLQDFGVHIGDGHRFLSSARPREAARIALDELGEQPTYDRFEDRLPSIYPRLAGLKVGFLATVLAAILVGLGGPLVAGGVYPLWWWALVPVAGVLAGGVRWLGLAHTQRAVRTLAEELQYGGLEVERVDRIAGWVRLEFVVHTREGAIQVSCLAVPWGSMTARHPVESGESVETRLPAADPIADRVATWGREGDIATPEGTAGST